LIGLLSGNPIKNDYMKTIISKTFNYLSKVRISYVFTIILGSLSLLWFLLRVIPKPSRASYPCQRAAFPMASAFVLWIVGVFLSRQLFQKGIQSLKQGSILKGVAISTGAILIIFAALSIGQLTDSISYAITQDKVDLMGEEFRLQEKLDQSSDLIKPKAVVGITKSKRAFANEIQFNEVDSLIRTAVNLAGGFDTLIHEGDTVVLKPNVIAARPQNNSYANSFPKEANGIATDYRVIQVVVNMVREKNKSGKIFIIEASGYGNTRKNMNALGYDNITGLDSIVYLDEFSGKWYDKTAPDLVKVKLPEGKNLYSKTNEYYLNKIYANAQVLISLPCLKTHFLTGITGGIKNVGIGATPVRIYGNGGTAVDDIPGRWNQINHGDFSTHTIPLDKWIHDFYMCRPVDYVIMDGLQGAQYGPFPDGKTLKNVQMNMRLILAGKDALAVDAIEAVTIGMDPYKVGHLLHLAKDNMGCMNPAYIKVNGDQPSDFKKTFFEGAPGNKCMYKDVVAPVVNLTGLQFVNSQLEFGLSATEEIAKVEIVYNDTILDPIVISNFGAIQIPTQLKHPKTELVSILVYDKYLNCTKLTSSSTGIQKLGNNPNLKVYPNPAMNFLKIENPFLNNSEVRYQILNSAGQKMAEGEFRAEINVSILKPGPYIMTVYQGKKSYQKTFIKE
jgi:uncharacterized protein (DUF362 family)